MENRPILITLLIAIFLGILSDKCVFAYNDARGGAHRAINRWAIARFEKDWMGQDSKDRYLKNATFNGRKPVGIDWSPDDGAKYMPPNKAFKRAKALKDWIIDGGWSADEPEWPMALVHFYDPINKAKPWLTDQQFVTIHLGKYDSTISNPETDAVRWTFDELNLEHFLDKFEQEFEWPQAKRYFQQALASKDPLNENYGKAWRAVGDIMHMVADMTVPAHVRNDGHAPFDKDPYEDNTYGRDVNMYKGGTNYAKNIKYYRLDARQLFIDVATYTNRNFFSKDTVLGKYLLPDVKKMTVDKNKYLKGTTEDGYTLLAAAPTTLMYRAFDRNTKYYVDYKVFKAQQRILIPTAVRAAAGILYAFLPRFLATINVSENQQTTGEYEVNCGIKTILSYNWPKPLKIANSAFVVVDDGKKQKKNKIPLMNRRDLNSFTTTVQAGDSDQIWVEYDLGGYVIKSASVQILPGPVITSLKPSSGKVGDTITISGTGFGAEQLKSTVTFKGTVASASSWSNTSIVVTVPTGASSGDVIVRDDAGRNSNGVYFEVKGAFYHKWSYSDSAQDLEEGYPYKTKQFSCNVTMSTDVPGVKLIKDTGRGGNFLIPCEPIQQKYTFIISATVDNKPVRPLITSDTLTSGCDWSKPEDWKKHDSPYLCITEMTGDNTIKIDLLFDHSTSRWQCTSGYLNFSAKDNMHCGRHFLSPEISQLK